LQEKKNKKMALTIIHLELVSLAIEDTTQTPTTHLSNKINKKKKAKNCTICGLI
jgi:hypothetical protein